MSLLVFVPEQLQVELSQAPHDPSRLEKIALFAWPIVVLIAILILRRPLTLFLENIGKHATEISIGSWATIKLPHLQEAPNDNSIPTIKDVAGTGFMESNTQLLAEFYSSTSSEYVYLDLGSGFEWISSRLFIFSVMLQRMKNVKCMVFTELGVFVGCASPEAIRWRLAADQPWLELAYANAYALVASGNPFGAGATRSPLDLARSNGFTRIDGSLNPKDAGQLVSNFVKSLKLNQAIPPFPPPPETVSISSGEERATWVTSSELNRIMGHALWVDSLPYDTSTDPETKKRYIRNILRKTSPYVAITVDRGFKSLVNRVALLDEVAENLL